MNFKSLTNGIVLLIHQNLMTCSVKSNMPKCFWLIIKISDLFCHWIDLSIFVIFIGIDLKLQILLTIWLKSLDLRLILRFNNKSQGINCRQLVNFQRFFYDNFLTTICHHLHKHTWHVKLMIIKDKISGSLFSLSLSTSFIIKRILIYTR